MAFISSLTLFLTIPALWAYSIGSPTTNAPLVTSYTSVTFQMSDTDTSLALSSSPPTPDPAAETIGHTDLQAMHPVSVWTLGVIYARSPACTYNMYDTLMVAGTLFSNIKAANTHLAYHCIRKDTIYHRKAGQFQLPRYHSSIILPISVKLCKHMVQYSVATNQAIMVPINDTWRGTNNVILTNETSFYQINAQNYTISNYYYHHSDILLDQDSGLIYSPSLNLTANCTYSQASCTTDRGVIIWNIAYEFTKPKVCNLQSRRSDICWINRSSLICPDLGIEFVDTERDKERHCGILLGFGRALIEVRHDLDTREINQPDRETKINMRTDFEHMYRMLKTTVERPAFVKLVHMGVCHYYALNLTLDGVAK